MGWWKEKRGQYNIELGDAPLDILGCAWDDIVSAYQEELGRPPTAEEIAEAVELSLGAFLEKGATSVSVKLNIQTIAVRTKLPTTGDLFTVPITETCLAVGRVITDKFLSEYGYLISIYDRVWASRPVVHKLQGLPFVFGPVFVSRDGWKSGRWKIIGNAGEHPNTYRVRFRMGAEELNGFSIKTLSLDGKESVVKASKEQVEGLSPLILMTDTALEGDLRDKVFPGSRDE